MEFAENTVQRNSQSNADNSLGMTPTHEQAVTLARQGQFDRARDMLQQLHAVSPHDTAVLYDYALCLSEMDQKTESIPLFQHLLDLEPGHVNGRVALGVAFAAAGRVAEAKEAFQKAVEIDPSNQYAVRSLGALAARAGQDDDAERLLRNSLALDPDDFYARVNLAKLLELRDHHDERAEADRLYKGILSEDPAHAVAEEARKGLTRLAATTVRSKAVGNLRMDAVFYMVDAIKRFRAMTPTLVGQITLEIAVLGRTGIDTTDADKRYEIKLLPEETFSGLNLLALMHVGVRQFKQDADTGTGLEDEYKTALAMTASSGQE